MVWISDTSKYTVSVPRLLHFGRQWSCIHQASSEKEGLITILDKKIKDFIPCLLRTIPCPLAVTNLLFNRFSVIMKSENHCLLMIWLNLLKENTDLNPSILQFSALLSSFSQLVHLWHLDIILLNKSKTNNFRPEVYGKRDCQASKGFDKHVAEGDASSCCSQPNFLKVKRTSETPSMGHHLNIEPSFRAHCCALA